MVSCLYGTYLGNLTKINITSVDAKRYASLLSTSLVKNSLYFGVYEIIVC
jgi:hypothetical protein